jgi:thymidine kinase
MCSGKTRHVIEHLRTEERHGHGRCRWAAFKPSTDTRSRPGKITSKADGDQPEMSIDAFEIPAKGNGLWEIFEYLRREEARIGTISLIVIDEINFFPTDSAFYVVVIRLLEQGYNLILSGLAYDYRDMPFGSTLLFAGMANKFVPLTAYCAVCHEDGANHSQRLRPDGSVVPFDDAQEIVDDGTKCRYEPRCDACFVVVGKPEPKY